MTAEEYLRKLMREKAERQSISPVSVNTETPENVLRGYLSAIEAPKSAPVQSVKVQPPTTIPKTQIQTPVVTKKDYFKDSQVNAEANKTPTTSIKDNIIPQAKDFTPAKLVEPEKDKGMNWVKDISKSFLEYAFGSTLKKAAGNEETKKVGDAAQAKALKTATTATEQATGSAEQKIKSMLTDIRFGGATVTMRTEDFDNITKAVDIVVKGYNDQIIKDIPDNALGRLSLAPVSGALEGVAGVYQGVGAVSDLGNLITKGVTGNKNNSFSSSTLIGNMTQGMTKEAYQEVRSNAGKVEGYASDLLNSAGRMLPGILAGGAGGAIAGNVTSALNYGGSSFAQDVKDGKTYEQALIHGTFTGIAEAYLQYYLGRLPGLSKVKGEGFVDKLFARQLSSLDNVIKTSVKSPVLQKLFKTAIVTTTGGLSEATEETLQQVMGNAYTKFIYKEKTPMNEGLWQSAWMGFAMSALLGVGGNISQGVSFNEKAKVENTAEMLKNFAEEQVAQIEPVKLTEQQYNGIVADFQQQMAESTDEIFKANMQQALDEFNAMYIPAEISTKTPQIDELPVGVQVDAQQANNSATQATTAETDAKMQSDKMFDDMLKQSTKDRWIIMSDDVMPGYNPNENGIYEVYATDLEQAKSNFKEQYGTSKVRLVMPMYDYRINQDILQKQKEQSVTAQPQTTDNIFDLGLTQNTQTEPMAVAELTADENNLVQMAKAKFNREVIITDNLPGNAEGMYDKGKIYVGRNADNVYYVFGHELTHSLEVGKDNQQAYNRLSRYVADTVIGRKNMQAEIEATKQRYAEIKPDMTDGEAYTEVIAKATGKYLFTDADAIAKIVRTDRSLASKIVQFLRETATRLAGTKEQKAVLKAIDLYRAALKQANTTENGKTQFATARIKKDTSEQTKEGTIGTLTIKNKGKSTNIRVEIVDRQFYAPILYGEKYNYYKAKVLSIEGYPNTPTSNEGKIRPASGYVFDNVVETRRIGDILIAKDEEFTDNFVPDETKTTTKYSIPEDYAMQHRPTESGAIASDISTNGEYMPKDVYTHPEWYFQLSGNDDYNRASRESWAVIRRIKGNPNAKVTIYRATVKNEFNTGDWVTLSETYAKMHAERANENKRESDLQSKVFSKQVTAKDIQFAGDDINEFGYYPQTESAKYSIPEDKAPKLPKELAGAKPKYGYKNKLYDIEFANDTDKALYIVGGKNKSARHNDYMLFLRQSYKGADGSVFIELGNEVREELKTQAAKAKDGDVLKTSGNQTSELNQLYTPETKKTYTEEKAPKTQRDKDSEEVKKEKQQRLERLTTILLKYSDKYEKGHDARVAEVDKLYSEGYKLVYGKNDSDISKSEPEPDKMQKVRDARGQTPGFIVSETNSNMYLSEEKITYKGKEYPRYRMAKYKEGKYRIYEADESTGSIRYEDRIIATDTTPTKTIKKLEVFINNSGMISRAWDKSERIDEYIKGQEKALQQYTDDYNSSTTDSAKSLYSDLIAKTKSEITRLKNEQSKLRQSAEPDKVYTEEKIPPIVETDESLPMKSTKRASRTAEGGLNADEIAKNAEKKAAAEEAKKKKAEYKKARTERLANRTSSEVYVDDMLSATDYESYERAEKKAEYLKSFNKIKDFLLMDLASDNLVDGEFNEDALRVAKKLATEYSQHFEVKRDIDAVADVIDGVGGITWNVTDADYATIKRAFGTNIKPIVDQLRRIITYRRNSDVGSPTDEVVEMIISQNSAAFGGENRPGTVTADEVVQYLLGYSEDLGSQTSQFYNPVKEGEFDEKGFIKFEAERIYRDALKQMQDEERAKTEAKKAAEATGKKSPEEVQAIVDKGIEKSGYKEPVTQEQLDNKQLIPNKITKDGKSVTVRGVFNTSLHMGLKNKETYPDIIDKTVNGNGTYTPESNKKTLDAAQKKIDRLGYDGALSEWEYKVVNDMRIRDIDVATAELLYKAAIEGGQGDIARKLLSEIAMIGTENGQAIQIISLFNKLNGEAHLITAQKIADRLNKQTEEQRKKQEKAPIEIPDNLAEKVRKAKTPAEKDAAFMEIKQDMYDQLPYGTWWERWNAWRYISMLGNFKTNIKNVGGNMGMLPLVAAKNLQLISMEKVANDKRLAQLKNIQAQMSKVKTKEELVELLGKANREDTGYVERLTQQLKDAGQLFEASILKTEMLNLNKRIEDGIGIYRTRAFHKSKAAHDFAVEDFKARAKSVMSGSSKYMGIPNSEFNDRRIFKFGLFEGARKLTNKPLDYGDKVFINRYYVNALASFLDANNVDIDAAKQAGEAIAKGETPADENAAKMVNLAREYATQEAREATFRDFSLITETIVEFRDAKTVATKHGTERTLKQSERIARRIAVDSVLPFVGTLVNITRRGAWEYNVGGLAKTILFDTNKVKTGEMSATTYLNNIAKGTTGSAVVLMGYLLGAAGIIVGRLPEDENEKDLAKTAGQQAYSLILGDHSYTIDWIAPFCIPLFLGVELSNLKKSGATQFKDYYQSGMNILSPLFELTLLKSVTDVVKAVKYENEPAQMFGVGVSTLGLNYLAQGTPTLFGQISRTITKEQKTSVMDEGNPFTRDQQVFVQKIMGKLFMNQNKQDYVNMFGETKDTGNVAQRIATNFFLPWYSSKLKDDATIKGMISLEKEKTDGLGVNTIPKIPSASLPGVGKYENKTFQLTADQLTELKKQVGIAQKLAADAFITSKNKVTLRTQYITGTSKDGYKNSLVSFTSVKNNSKGMYSDEDLKVKAIDKAMNKAYNDAVIEFIKAHNDLTLKK